MGVGGVTVVVVGVFERHIIAAALVVSGRLCIVLFRSPWNTTLEDA